MALNLQQQMELPKATEQYATKMPINTISIDGNIIKGYFIYSYFDAKSYSDEPYRSTNGVIDNLNAYVTFLTPRLKINFKYLHLETYKTLMKLFQQKNEFIVSCYDIVWDRIINKKMYFVPQNFPEIFQKKLEILAMINYEVELVGTNAELDLLNITYHKNDGSGITQGSLDFSYGQEVLIGRGVDFTPPSGKKFSVWNTEADGTGFTYLDNQAYVPPTSLILYAQYITDNIFNLTYNYGYGETYIDTTNNNLPLFTRTIIQGMQYGTLPTTQPLSVTFNDIDYNPFVFRGWFRTSTIGTNSVAIQPTDIYSVQGDSAIFQIYEPTVHTITFNSNGGDYNPSIIRQDFGTSVFPPPNPTKENFTFAGWWLTETFDTNTLFSFSQMPPTNIVLYAKYEAVL